MFKSQTTGYTYPCTSLTASLVLVTAAVSGFAGADLSPDQSCGGHYYSLAHNLVLDSFVEVCRVIGGIERAWVLKSDLVGPLRSVVCQLWRGWQCHFVGLNFLTMWCENCLAYPVWSTWYVVSSSLSNSTVNSEGQGSISYIYGSIPVPRMGTQCIWLSEEETKNKRWSSFFRCLGLGHHPMTEDHVVSHGESDGLSACPGLNTSCLWSQVKLIPLCFPQL